MGAGKGEGRELRGEQQGGSVGDRSACFLATRIRIRYSEVRIRILPFSHKGVERTEIMFAK